MRPTRGMPDSQDVGNVARPTEAADTTDGVSRALPVGVSLVAIPPPGGRGVNPKPVNQHQGTPASAGVTVGLPARAAGDGGGFLLAVVGAQLVAQVRHALAAQGVA